MYKEMYYTLFNAVTDAIEALDARNYGQAEDILKTAQQQAEERYMDGPESKAFSTQRLDNSPPR